MKLEIFKEALNRSLKEKGILARCEEAEYGAKKVTIKLTGLKGLSYPHGEIEAIEFARKMAYNNIAYPIDLVFVDFHRTEPLESETITRTSYACSDCGREYEQRRGADECCFAGCPHTWELDKTRDWEDGMFTMYVSCRKCGTTSYIEGHADENSDSNPTPKFNAESFNADVKMDDRAWVAYYEYDFMNLRPENPENITGDSKMVSFRDYRKELYGVYLTTHEAKKAFNLLKGSLLGHGDWKDGQYQQVINGYKQIFGGKKTIPMQMKFEYIPIRRFGYDTAMHTKTKNAESLDMKNAQGSNMIRYGNVLMIAIDISASTETHGLDGKSLNDHYRKIAISTIMSMKPEEVYIVPYSYDIEEGWGGDDWREAVKWLNNDKNLQPLASTLPLDNVLEHLEQMQTNISRDGMKNFTTMILTDIKPLTHGFNRKNYKAEGESEYECQVCGKPADYNFQDATIRWDIINDEFSGSPKVSEYAGQMQNDFYCQEHADEMETSDFFAESLKFKEWADQEMMTHGGRESFQDWLDDEVSSHGNTSLEDWGEHEIASHEARYEAENVLSMKNLGAVAVGGALGIALVGLFTGKNLLTDMTSKLSKASEAKKDCHSCNTNGSVRKNQTQVLSSEYSVGQINPVEVEGQQDIHGAEGVNNPRFAPSPSPAPHRAKSSKWL